MALKIINEKIIGKIDKLDEKLEGKLPITREELLYLINSWGRKTCFYTKDSQNKDIYIESCEPTQSEQALLVRTQSEQTRFVRKECYTHLL